MQEQELIENAKRGDSQAFAILFQHHYPFLVKYLIKVTMNYNLAEELAQETMTKCIEKIRLYNGKSAFSSWLISIATNVYIDQCRKNKREKKCLEQMQTLREMRWQFETQNEEWADVNQALGQLASNYRIPIVLKHYYGYTYEEISKMLNISVGTAKSRIHYGIDKIRRELKISDEKQSNTHRRQKKL
ncbi:RNA polymerase sigma factor SigY [Bacillus sp. SCS-151]|uniref:RNA polymerase sigma factor SigY n=1 Tax=Nanhaiella sioensis TaxID=3115293 RepID=UPI00397E78FD